MNDPHCPIICYWLGRLTALVKSLRLFSVGGLGWGDKLGLGWRDKWAKWPLYWFPEMRLRGGHWASDLQLVSCPTRWSLYWPWPCIVSLCWSSFQQGNWAPQCTRLRMVALTYIQDRLRWGIGQSGDGEACWGKADILIWMESSIVGEWLCLREHLLLSRTEPSKMWYSSHVHLESVKDLTSGDLRAV